MLEIITEGIKVSVPIMVAAFGGLFGELAGVLNIALEGQILIASLFSVYTAHITHNLIWGLIGGIFASSLLSLVFVVFSFGFRANIFLVGLGINLLALSISEVFSIFISGKKGSIVFHNIPHLSEIWIFSALLLFLLTYVIVYNTRFGFHLRAVGENESASIFSGVYPGFYRIFAIILSGVFCGISGFLISIPLSVFVQNISGGRGWLAIIAIFIGGRKPVGVFIASLLIGIVFTFSHFIQIMKGIDPEITMTFPYIASLLFLIFYKRRSNS
ncbi:MAG TPA: ABC transporter permease [Candidatus Atribacteria bacterium]|nr:ABC transporter permease [Candidatus Atribacteria bacterium]